VSPVIATVPARADFVHVLRTVVAAVAARLDFPYDALDDLRMVVDEACSALLGISSPARTLTLKLTPEPDHLEVMVCTDAQDSSWPRPDVERTLAWKVLDALTDEARFETVPAGPAVRAIKRFGHAGSVG
jgi:serine/threonine-protein kinase RsbW